MASRKLTDARIKGNGIEVELEISENGWPPEIDEVRRRILSFECIIPPKQVSGPASGLSPATCIRLRGLSLTDTSEDC